MNPDEIITEVWRVRDRYAATHGHDLARMAADLRRREREHPHRVIDRSAASEPTPAEVRDKPGTYGNEA